MFLLTRRQAHAALAGAGTALAYLAAAEVGSKKPVRVGGLFVLSSMALAGLMTAKSSVKARGTEDRLNNFFNNGGSVGGDFHVNGNHFTTGDSHIAGSLFGTGGTLTAGDAIHVNGNPLTADGTITSHSNINATTGTITGGTVASNGDVLAGSGTVHAGGVASSGTVTATGNITSSAAIRGSNTTGDTTLGTLTAGTGDYCSLPESQAIANRLNDLLNALG